MSSGWNTLTRTLLIIAGALLALAFGIPLGESLDWPGFSGHGYLTLLLAFAGVLCGTLGIWLRMAGPRAATRVRTLTHLTLWVAMPMAFAGCLVQGALQVWEAQQSMSEA